MHYTALQKDTVFWARAQRFNDVRHTIVWLHQWHTKVLFGLEDHDDNARRHFKKSWYHAHKHF